MRTITIELEETLAELAADNNLDFSYDVENPEEWFVVGWHHNEDGDVVYATCCDGETNELYTFSGVDADDC